MEQKNIFVQRRSSQAFDPQNLGLNLRSADPLIEREKRHSVSALRTINDFTIKSGKNQNVNVSFQFNIQGKQDNENLQDLMTSTLEILTNMNQEVRSARGGTSPTRNFGEFGKKQSLNRKTKEQIQKIIKPSQDSQFSYKPKFFKIKSPEKEDDNKSYKSMKSEETKLHLIKKYNRSPVQGTDRRVKTNNGFYQK